ncbi:MAG: tRNA (adenosine(37)-N6)-threonylcarbamoyltransferase complex dimerization subunit type 1 TsaB [Gammaproteobacteria bacterium]|nr:tRNA (adenosine(37)-N6)-threonylcarbamoyltransferase complex dimerization subunit type 1 TsaB [Gammaproteobacteria bacterium]
MSGFRCLALETGVRPSTVAACNGDRHFETSVPGGARIAAALYETIDRVLDEVDISLDDLDCIAFGRGPGAFTGLRVAAAAAQGLATGLGIRVCAVSSLAALAQDAWDRAVESGGSRAGGRPALREAGDGLPPGDASAPEPTWIAPALPAGRHQVYVGWYRIAESGLVSAETDDRLAPTAQSRLPGTARFVAAGKIWSEDEALQAANAGRIAAVADSAAPRARAVLRLAKQEYGEGRLLRPEDARPVYLRGALGDPAYKA